MDKINHLIKYRKNGQLSRRCKAYMLDLVSEHEGKIVLTEKGLNYKTPWETIFKFKNWSPESFENNQIQLLTSKEITKACSQFSQVSQKESRILAKVDSYNELPRILKNLKLSILPVRNGTYSIFRGNIWKKIEYTDTNVITLPKHSKISFTSQLLNFGNSEMSVIDDLYYSGALKYFDNSELIIGPICGGRHRTSKFSFNTTYHDIITKHEIEGVQMEIDSCYESENKCIIIEGKSGKADSFNIRQLYYPYRVINQIYNGTKEIIPLIIIKKKEIYYVWKYQFTDVDNMNSITLVDSKQFKLI